MECYFLVDYLYIFNVKSLIEKAKLVSILDFFYSLLFQKLPSYNIEKKKKYKGSFAFE